MQHLLASSRIFEDTKEDREQDNVMIHKEITDGMYRIGIRKKSISAFASAIDWPRTEEAFGEQWGTV